MSCRRVLDNSATACEACSTREQGMFSGGRSLAECGVRCGPEKQPEEQKLLEDRGCMVMRASKRMA